MVQEVNPLGVQVNCGAGLAVEGVQRKAEQYMDSVERVIAPLQSAGGIWGAVRRWGAAQAYC